MRQRLAAPIALGLAALTAWPAVALAFDATSPEELRRHWWSEWSLSPLQLAPIVVGALLYGVRARRLGRRLPVWRMACFYGGVAVLTLAVTSPVDVIGEDALFSIHMLQHVMIGDLAALLVVLGVSGPVLRPALAIPWVRRLRFLAHPLVALPLWAASLYLWHLPALYELSLSNDFVHFLEHSSFFVFGCLMWAAVVEPLPGPAWFGTGPKLAYIGVVRATEAILGNIFWFAGSVIYTDYATRAPAFGVSAAEDQVNAGTVMMFESGAVTLAAILYFFFRMAREGELRQALIENGVDPAAARRAVRYGRGDVLARRLGLRRDPGGGGWVRTPAEAASVGQSSITKATSSS
jgi:cytochrome c oxidase assembly factor CtaG